MVSRAVTVGGRRFCWLQGMQWAHARQHVAAACMPVCPWCLIRRAAAACTGAAAGAESKRARSRATSSCASVSHSWTGVGGGSRGGQHEDTPHFDSRTRSFRPSSRGMRRARASRSAAHACTAPGCTSNAVEAGGAHCACCHSARLCMGGMSMWRPSACGTGQSRVTGKDTAKHIGGSRNVAYTTNASQAEHAPVGRPRSGCR